MAAGHVEQRPQFGKRRTRKQGGPPHPLYNSDGPPSVAHSTRQPVHSKFLEQCRQPRTEEVFKPVRLESISHSSWSSNHRKASIMFYDPKCHTELKEVSKSQVKQEQLFMKS